LKKKGIRKKEKKISICRKEFGMNKHDRVEMGRLRGGRDMPNCFFATATKAWLVETCNTVWF
jgi:hypothetical protein